MTALLRSSRAARLLLRSSRAARLALGSTAALGSASAAAASESALCEHPDARWFREQTDHQALGLTAVEEARQGHWYEVARKCREGDPNEADVRGVSVLHYAAKAGRRQLVDILLGLGATPGAADRVHGRTPLHLAAAAGHMSTMQALLDAGADAAAADAAGATPLHLAAQAGERGAVKLLLGRCDPNVRDLYGVTPLHKAVAFGQATSVAALLDDPRTEVDRPVGEPRAPAEHGALSGGETPLLLAASHTYHFHHTKHTRIASLLLAAGADPNLVVAEAGGQTAAHRAAQAGNAGVVASLLRCGRARWELRDDRGRTPRELAEEHGRTEVTRLLDAAGV